MRHISFCGVVCLAVAAFCVTGCGMGGAGKVVTGKITYQGTPLPSGTVAFVGESGIATGSIVNGEYKVSQAPVGPVKISVTTPTAAPAAQMGQKVEGKTFAGGGAAVISVPGNYSNADTSGLTYTVTKESAQTHDLMLQ